MTSNRSNTPHKPLKAPTSRFEAVVVGVVVLVSLVAPMGVYVLTGGGF